MMNLQKNARMLELDIAICTYGADGPSRVAMMLLPPEEGVRYVVSWQEHGDAVLPEILKDRKDVAVFRLIRKVSPITATMLLSTAQAILFLSQMMTWSIIRKGL